MFPGAVIRSVKAAFLYLAMVIGVAMATPGTVTMFFEGAVAMAGLAAMSVRDALAIGS